MALLCYCILTTQAQVALPGKGVGSAEVRDVREGGLRCIFSDYDAPVATRASALEFHAVVHQVFAQAAVIQFRFPTLLPSESELSEFMQQHQHDYMEALCRWQNDVQMEIHISPAGGIPSRQSGREYLQARGERERLLDWMAGQFAHALTGCISAWRRHKTSSGLRCFALVNRAEVNDFQRRVGALGVPEELRVVVSGPWPVSEFLREGKAA